MQVHELKRKTKLKTSKTVGRGGKRGKTSGRGHKGQKARAGRKLRPELRDIIKRLPKRRGYGKNRARTVNSGVIKPAIVNLSAINEVFSNGDEVNPKELLKYEVISTYKGGLPKVKILGNGEITKSVTITKCIISNSAKEKIEKAGGKVVV